MRKRTSIEAAESSAVFYDTLEQCAGRYKRVEIAQAIFWKIPRGAEHGDNSLRQRCYHRSFPVGREKWKDDPAGTCDIRPRGPAA